MIAEDQRLRMILEDCIERLRAGETEADCLARHGDEAAAIAPLLRAANRLQSVGVHSLSPDQRGQAKAALRAAMLEHNHSSVRTGRQGLRPIRLTLAGPVRGLAMAVTLSIALIMLVTITAVAASRPGDLAYPLRVIVERAPVLFSTTATARTMTELRISERRLADLEAHVASNGQVVPAALQALLAGDQAAAGWADELSAADRALAASQVAAHAKTLARLAQSVREPSARLTLQTASTRAEELALGLVGDSAADGERAPAGAAEVDAPSGSTSATPTSTPSSAPGTAPARPATETPRHSTPQPAPNGATPTIHPVGPGQRATALSQTATATDAAAPMPTPSHTRAPDTPEPGRRATALAQTATATPTAPPDTPVPGRRATQLAQTATATHAAASDTPVPGRRATALAQTATPGSGGDSGDSGSRPPSTPQAPQPPQQGNVEAIQASPRSEANGRP